MDQGAEILTRVKGQPDAPWLRAIYQKVIAGYRIVFPDGTIQEAGQPHSVRTLRATTTRNYRKWKTRRNVLNKALKEKKITLWTQYWWAKYWRKSESLHRLASELAEVPDLPDYNISNRERSRVIIEAIAQSTTYYRKFDLLFTDVDTATFAYQEDEFVVFAKDHRDQQLKRDIPYRFVAYFKP
jgi:hypothetical protein